MKNNVIWQKRCIFYGDYDDRNMRLEKSRDLGYLGHFLVNFRWFIQKTPYRKKLYQDLKFLYDFSKSLILGDEKKTYAKVR